ncbi:MAG: CDP-diacylglycerol--serine O-phosphatidyltransferase [Helicobacteraceae bacterium]|jgi:CDP-diacylglycerol--serine O-phosphatidyltransferase|nr:CDP-diacylglycerol--serine O-phosphatidyltransferase [Helicobacteraceae bacterium]
MVNIKNLKIAYLLPNLFTAGSMFLAVLAIVAASKGVFEKAFWFVVLSAIFDALDGRVARLTKTSSQFGKEFDSLADVVAFGVAPAFIFYFAAGEEFGRFGILAAALFVIFGAVRLARFNVISATTEPNVFIGLPIPAAALFVVGATMLCINYNGGEGAKLALLIAAVIIAVLMVSNIRYPSFKQAHFQKSYFLRALIALIIVCSLFYLYQTEFLALIALIYALVGPARALWTIAQRKRKVRHNEQTD